MFKKLIHSRAIRTRTSLILAIVLVPPFIFFFHLFTGQPSGGRNGVAGTMFGRPVPWETFWEEQRLLRREWESRSGPLPEDFGPILAQETWDRLLLVAEAKRRKLRVTNQELAARIQQLPEFQQEGRFSRERYGQLLQAMGWSPQRFEAMMRDRLLVQRLVREATAATTGPEEERQQAYAAWLAELRRRATFQSFLDSDDTTETRNSTEPRNR